MKANSFFSEQEIQDQVKKMIAEQTNIVTFTIGKRAKAALVVKSSEEYAQYKQHILQYDITVDRILYAIICGVK